MTTPCHGVDNVVSMVNQPGYLRHSHSWIGPELNQRVRAGPTFPRDGIEAQQHDGNRAVEPRFAPVVDCRLAGRFQATGTPQVRGKRKRKQGLQPVVKLAKDFRSGRH